MLSQSCPQCHADLDNDVWESTGRAECPFCGAELPELATAPPTVDLDADAGSAVTLPPLPPKSIVKVIQATDDRCVFYIPGGRSGGIGCFALMWNGFMTVFTGFWAYAMIEDNPGWGTLLGLSAFLSLFWAIGIGMAIWWVKAKYQRLFVMLEPKRMVIQRVLFGRKRIDDTLLNEYSRAELVESYRENEKPVYRIEVVGDNRTAKFGTALSRQEKNWLVDRINEFINAPTGIAIGERPKFCFQCGASLEGVEPDEDDEEFRCPKCGQELPLGSSVLTAASAKAEEEEDDVDINDPTYKQPADLLIDEQTSDHLRFHLPINSHPWLGWIICAISVPFGMFFSGSSLMTILDFDNFNWISTIFSIPFILAGLVPISVGLFALRGRITVDLTPEWLKVRYHLGLLGKTKKLPTKSLTAIKLMTGSSSDDRRLRDAPRRAHKSNIASSVATSGTEMIPMTLIHNRDTARFVTQLVRRQLREMGVSLESDQR